MSSKRNICVCDIGFNECHAFLKFYRTRFLLVSFYCSPQHKAVIHACVIHTVAKFDFVEVFSLNDQNKKHMKMRKWASGYQPQI